MSATIEPVASLASTLTNVSCTLTDVNDSLWTNARVVVTFVAPPNTASPYLYNGEPFQLKYRFDNIGASGSFDIELPPNIDIVPEGGRSLWRFDIGPNWDNQASVSFVTQVAGPSMDLSPSFKYASQYLIEAYVQSMPIPRAAEDADVIISPNDGQIFYNTSEQVMKFWANDSWNGFGEVGEQGPIGPTGPQGATGPTGPQGPIGNTGAVGPAGPKGETGAGVSILGNYPTYEALVAAHPTGSLGDAWLVGPDLYVWNGEAWQNVGTIQGPQGDVGPMGPQGIQGNPGTTGPAGATGPQGSTGATGAIGPAGPTGATGPQGPIGNTGPIGPIGNTGPAGADFPEAPTTGAIYGRVNSSWKGIISPKLNLPLGVTEPANAAQASPTYGGTLFSWVTTSQAIGLNLFFDGSAWRNMYDGYGNTIDITPSNGLFVISTYSGVAGGLSTLLYQYVFYNGRLTLGNDPVGPMDAASKQYVDGKLSLYNGNGDLFGNPVIIIDSTLVVGGVGHVTLPFTMNQYQGFVTVNNPNLTVANGTPTSFDIIDSSGTMNQWITWMVIGSRQ